MKIEKTLKSVEDVSLDVSLDELMDDVESSAELNAGDDEMNHYKFIIDDINRAFQEDSVSIRAQWTQTSLPRPIFDEFSSTKFVFSFQLFEIKDWEFLWRAKLLRDGKIIDKSMKPDVSDESQFTQGSLDIDKLVVIT